MKLPETVSIRSPEKCVMQFFGIDRSGKNPSCLYDAVNLSFSEGCKTRAARSAIYTLDTVPDQMIVCEDRLFVRNGNTLREIEKDDAGSPTGVKQTYALQELEDSPDRILIIDGQDLCILPDGIRIHSEADDWLLFGSGYSQSAALPFQNSRTLFYTSGFSGGEVCGDAERLQLGVQMRFSWLGEEVFTVVQAESAVTNSATMGGDVLAGTRITLDKAVTGWNALSASAYAMTRHPQILPLIQKVHLGCNNPISFYGSSIRISTVQGRTTYTQELKNYLHIGQRVQITGSSVSGNNKTAVIIDVGTDQISFDTDFASCTEPQNSELVLSPLMPDFDFALLLGGRLFGADNTKREFWISAQDEPFCFYDHPMVERDAWRTALTQKVTGLTMWKDNVICFEENGAFRLLGSHALNFGTTRLPVSGMLQDCKSSLAQIGDTLFYCSARGFMKYSGGSDIRISPALPNINKVVGATTAGGRYYAMTDERIWVYDPDKAVWWSESADGMDRIFTLSAQRFLCRDKALYLADGAVFAIDWNLLTAELPVETGSLVQPVSLKIELQSTAGCELSFLLKPRGYQIFDKITSVSVHGEKTLRLPLHRVWCEGFQLKIEGNGDCEIQNVTVFYRRKEG